MIADFRYRQDKLVDDCCHEEGHLVPAIVAATKKEAGREEIHLITQFSYGLLYCRFSNSCRSTQPQKPSLTIVIPDPVHDLLQNNLSGVWEAFWLIRIVKSARRNIFPETLDTCALRLRFKLETNIEVLAFLCLSLSL